MNNDLDVVRVRYELVEGPSGGVDRQDAVPTSPVPIEKPVRTASRRSRMIMSLNGATAPALNTRFRTVREASAQPSLHSWGLPGMSRTIRP